MLALEEDKMCKLHAETKKTSRRLPSHGRDGARGILVGREEVRVKLKHMED
jgi:hypothetical protein